MYCKYNKALFAFFGNFSILVLRNIKNVPLTVCSDLYWVDNYFDNPSGYLFVFFFSTLSLRAFVIKNIVKKEYFFLLIDMIDLSFELLNNILIICLMFHFSDMNYFLITNWDWVVTGTSRRKSEKREKIFDFHLLEIY